MNKNTLKRIDEIYYEHQLSNGLKVIIIPKKDFNTSSFYLGFPYGSLDSKQMDSYGNVYHDPLGIAHFLEHKLFENNNGLDIMRVFSALGASVNAFTSHNETVYLFSSNTNVKKSLQLLLDFVFKLEITEESVDKEKGIIEQELRMYAQMPEQRLILETFKSLYNTHPIRNDIGGTIDSVQSITKEALEAVFARNYHPANAVLICISPIAPKRILQIIEDRMNIKTYDHFLSPKRYLDQEFKAVARAHYEFKMDIQASKMTYAFKLSNLSTDPLLNLKNEWILRLFLELIFSPLNPEYQKWLENQHIHDYFGYEVELNTEYGFVLFFGETEDIETFKFLIDHAIDSFNESLLEGFVGLIRRNQSSLIRSLNHHDDYAMGMMRSLFNKISFEKQYEILNQINVDDLKDLNKMLMSCDRSIVFMKKNRNL